MLASSFPYFQKNGMMARIYSKWFSWHGLSLGKHPHFHGMKIAFVFALHGWYDFFFAMGRPFPKGIDVSLMSHPWHQDWVYLELGYTSNYSHLLVKMMINHGV
jgi:hypothetical protein